MILDLTLSILYGIFALVWIMVVLVVVGYLSVWAVAIAARIVLGVGNLLKNIISFWSK